MRYCKQVIPLLILVPIKSGLRGFARFYFLYFLGIAVKKAAQEQPARSKIFREIYA